MAYKHCGKQSSHRTTKIVKVENPLAERLYKKVQASAHIEQDLCQWVSELDEKVDLLKGGLFDSATSIETAEIREEMGDIRDDLRTGDMLIADLFNKLEECQAELKTLQTVYSDLEARTVLNEESIDKCVDTKDLELTAAISKSDNWSKSPLYWLLGLVLLSQALLWAIK